MLVFSILPDQSILTPRCSLLHLHTPHTCKPSRFRAVALDLHSSPEKSVAHPPPSAVFRLPNTLHIPRNHTTLSPSQDINNVPCPALCIPVRHNQSSSWLPESRVLFPCISMASLCSMRVSTPSQEGNESLHGLMDTPIESMRQKVRPGGGRRHNCGVQPAK